MPPTTSALRRARRRWPSPARSAQSGVVGIVAGPDLVGERRRARSSGPVASSGSAARQPRSTLRDRLVAGRGDRHPPPGGDQREDRPGGDVGLAGAGRPLDRQHACPASRGRRASCPRPGRRRRGCRPPARRRAAAPGARAGRRGRDAAAGRTGRRSRPHRGGEAARVERRRRMQRQPVGQGDAPAGADLHRGGPASRGRARRA